jgi:hypothetical protein
VIRQIEEKLGAAGGRLSVEVYRPRWLGRLLGDPGWHYADHFQVVDREFWDDADMTLLKELPDSVRSVNLERTQIFAGRHLANGRLVHQPFMPPRPNGCLPRPTVLVNAYDPCRFVRKRREQTG